MDRFSGIKGQFSIDVYNDDKIIDTYTDKNLVVTGSRAAVSALCSGIKGSQPINRLSLGTRGYDPAKTKFDPKVVRDAPYVENGKELFFNEDRAKLFTEEYNEYTFDIKWYPVPSAAESQKVSGVVFFGGSEVTDTSGTFVETFTDLNSITYTFTIEEGIGHGSTGDFIPYTEAGLYAGGVLFSIKTFAAKVKDEATKFVITWKIYF